MPTDTGSIVAALTDTSETPAGGAEVPSSKRDSEFPTMALPADQVAALQRKALADGAGPVSEKTHNEPVASVNAGELMNTTDEHPALIDFNDETIARPFEMPKPVESAPMLIDDDEDVVVVDDIAEVVEGEEEEVPKPRSSMPPPIPRN